jgi:hypothetical protein
MVSQFKTKVIVEVADQKAMFILVRPLVYFSALLQQELVVPPGFHTDFASIPWIFHSFCQVNGKHRAAAVLHDYLCVHGKELGITQKQADQVFLEAMEVLGVRFSQRKVMYGAVRTYQSITGWFK